MESPNLPKMHSSAWEALLSEISGDSRELLDLVKEQLPSSLAAAVSDVLEKNRGQVAAINKDVIVKLQDLDRYLGPQGQFIQHLIRTQDGCVARLHNEERILNLANEGRRSKLLQSMDNLVTKRNQGLEMQLISLNHSLTTLHMSIEELKHLQASRSYAPVTEALQKRIAEVEERLLDFLATTSTHWMYGSIVILIIVALVKWFFG